MVFKEKSVKWRLLESTVCISECTQENARKWMIGVLEEFLEATFRDEDFLVAEINWLSNPILFDLRIENTFQFQIYGKLCRVRVKWLVLLGEGNSLFFELENESRWRSTLSKVDTNNWNLINKAICFVFLRCWWSSSRADGPSCLTGPPFWRTFRSLMLPSPSPSLYPFPSLYLYL